MILQRIGIPIYLQVKTYIMDKIKAGELKPGSKLPTERDLAAELGIARNTVSAAYKELLLEGVLEARQGRGTFVKGEVSSESDAVSGSKRERLLRIIDEAMARSAEIGFTVDQFAAIAQIRAQAKVLAVRELRVALVDCTAEFMNHFALQISQLANIRLETIILADLETGRTPVDLLNACDLVITTAEHQAALVKILGGSGKLITVAVTPRLEAVAQLARLNASVKTAVVARSCSFVNALEKLLRRINSGSFNLAVLEKKDDLRDADCYQVLIVSEETEQEVRQVASSHQEIIVFSYEIDQGSLSQLMARLVALAN